jgi:N-acetylglutamate synthase-like GNAT family acetyltransferase
MVRGAKINPRGLRWQRFVVAEEDGRLIGVAQVRCHSDGTHELASLVVRPEHRGERIATRMIDTLLAEELDQTFMLVDRPFAEHYARWGFREIGPRALPRSVAREYLIGRVVTMIGSVIVRRRIRIVPLVRAAPRARPTRPSGRSAHRR